MHQKASFSPKDTLTFRSEESGITNLPISSTATANAEFVLCEWATIHRSSADVAFMIFFQIKLYIIIYFHTCPCFQKTPTQNRLSTTQVGIMFMHTPHRIIFCLLSLDDVKSCAV